MSNKEIYEFMNILGMLDKEDGVCCSEEEYESTPKPEDVFQGTCQNLPRLISFVNDLFINNDINTIKDLLICMLYNN